MFIHGSQSRQCSGLEKGRVQLQFSVTTAQSSSLGPKRCGTSTQSSTRCRRRFEVRRRGGKLKRPWEAAMYPGATFFLTLARLGWSANAARHLVIHNDRWTCWRLRRRQLRGGWKRHCFFGQTHLLVTRPLFSTGSLQEWTHWHQSVVVELATQGAWTQ